MSAIPEKLFVALRAPIEMKFKPEEEKNTIIPAFIVPSDSEKFVAAANGWKQGYRNNRGSTTIENKPVSGIRIVGFSRRSGGGRAYKVVYPPNYLVDLREDVLLDTIYHMGINAGGRMNGEYIWSTNGSQMRLIRVGSQEYQNCISKTQIDKLPRIPVKDLKEGTVYVGKSGSAAIFLGHISTILATTIWDYNMPHRDSSFYNRRFSRIETRKQKAMLWFKTYGNKNVENTIEMFNEYFSSDENRLRGGFPSIDISHSMRKVCKTIQLPENIVFLIRDRFSQTILFEAERRINELSSSGANFSREDADITMASTLCNRSDILNMVPYGQDPMEYMLPQMERIINL